MVSLFGQTKQAPPTLSYVDRAVVAAAASSCAEIRAVVPAASSCAETRAVVPAAPSCREKKGTPPIPISSSSSLLTQTKNHLASMATTEGWIWRGGGPMEGGSSAAPLLGEGGVCCFIHSFDLGTKQQKTIFRPRSFFF